MVHITETVAFQHLILPISEIVSMLEAIQKFWHKLRVAFGYAEITYGVIHIPECFLQVNGYAPQIWSTLSLVIFASLLEQGFGVQFSNSFTGEFTQIVGFSYIEDCDLILPSNNVNTTHQYTQDSLLEWEALIEVTGGCLAPNKIAWYLVDYEWNRVKCKCTNPGIQKPVMGGNMASQSLYVI